MATTQIVPVEGGVEVLMTTADERRAELAPILQAATDLSANSLRDIMMADLEAGAISSEQITLTEAGK